MLDERLYPCLLLVQTLESEQDRIKKILNLAKTVGETQESLRLFFLLKSVPGSPWKIPKEIPEVKFLADFQDYRISGCSDLLASYPEDYSKICCLCPYSPRYSNSKKECERLLLSALISDQRNLYIKKSMVLKPGNLKSRYCFIADRQLFIIPLHQLLLQYIQNSNSLQIPDNPLIDNLKTPNWERILDTFLTSPIFKRATKWQQLSGPVQGPLYSSVKESLLSLQPTSAVDTQSFDNTLKDILARKRYSPLHFGESKAPARKASTEKKSSTAMKKESPSPLVGVPTTVKDEPAILLPDLISTSNGQFLTQKALAGLFSPMEQHPRPPIKEEIIQDYMPNETGPVAETEPDEEKVNEGLFLGADGWFDVSRLLHDHSILPFRLDMIRGYLCDAYIAGCIILDCSYCDGVPGILLYVPGQGTASWTKMESCIYILDVLLSEPGIKKITWNWTEVAAACLQYGIHRFYGICSLTAVYCAAVDTPALYPLSDMLETCGIHYDTSSPCDLITLIKSYPDLYKHFYLQIRKVVGLNGIRLWETYEIALATSVNLHPQIEMKTRNLTRTSVLTSEFSFTPRHRKLTRGVYIDIHLQAGDREGQLRLESDDKLNMNILSSLFSSPVLLSYKLKLLTCQNGHFTFFAETKSRHELAYVEELISKVIARKFRTFHYAPPSMTVSYY